ncbi:hypothetical protein MD484_g2559, partial [Candolleomyces efflorescens]
MPVFDFFPELTGTAAANPWILAVALAACHYSSSAPTASRKLTDVPIHALARDFIPCPAPRSPPAPPRSSKPPVHMPLELVLAIIEAADGPETIALLKACSLVCRAWSVPVQKLLFRSVTLRTDTAYASFKAAVGAGTPHSRVLAAAIRHLRVVVDYSQPSYLHQRAFAHAVTMCPNLQELDVALYGFADSLSGAEALGTADSSRFRRRAPSFDDETLEMLRSGPSIQSLSFSNWSENQECVFQLLDLWPSLRSLSMSGTCPHLLPSSSSTPFPGSLESLRINFQTPPSIEFMSWLLHQSQTTGSLRSLTFDRDPCPDLFDHFLDAFGPSLQSLSTPNFPCNTARTVESCCDNLETLRMDRPQLNPLAYKSVPKTIKHLVIGIDRDTPLQPVIDVVKGRPTLEEVTVRMWNGGEAHRLLPALKIACAYRGVDLRVTKDA